MSLQVVPLTTSPNQTATIQLSVDGNPLIVNISVSYNQMAGYWILSISDASNNLLIDSIPMVTGTYPAGNLLQQQKYLNIGSWYIVNVSNLVSNNSGDGYGLGLYGAGGYGGLFVESGYDYPDDTNLGTDFQLWVDDTPVV